MNTLAQFCSNPSCPVHGHVGQGNIVIHSRQEERYRCKACGVTFSETKGTVFYRLNTDHDHVSYMISLMKHGCPPQAIVATYHHDERTVYDWCDRGGGHCQQVHETFIEQKKVNLQHIQADELCIRTAKLRKDEVQDQEQTVQKGDELVQSQGGDLSVAVQEVAEINQFQEVEPSASAESPVDGVNHMWMAMAMDVVTRLWLGGVVGAHRDGKMILSLAQQVRACAKNWNFLLCVDGLSSYVSAFMSVFSWFVFTGLPGRPKRETVPGLMIAQVIKGYSKGRVKEVIRRIVRGSAEAVALVLKMTGCAKINTSFIERLNATFRGRFAALVRRGRAIAHTESQVLERGMYLAGCTYNFCYFHDSLRVEAPIGGPRKWVERTPAMAAGWTDHRWTMKELLSYKVLSKPKTKIVHG